MPERGRNNGGKPPLGVIVRAGGGARRVGKGGHSTSKTGVNALMAAVPSCHCERSEAIQGAVRGVGESFFD
jgi:hypothetical protein